MSDHAVFVEICGGLANQMFQYSAGRALARHLDCPLKLDLSPFDSYELWPYQLDRFRLLAGAATVSEVAPLKRKKNRLRRAILRAKGHRGGALRHRVFQEPHWHFSPELFAQQAPILLQGYWQSPRYFTQVRDGLLREFVLKDPLSPYSQDMVRQISEQPSVSIHVRRGDYVADPGTAKVHGICDLDYYRRAVGLMSRLEPEARFYIFSDDIAFVREAFDFCPSPVIVDGNQDAGHEDMILMSACTHNIIANSSFSWWGAWLGEAPGKIVIAPRKWFAEERLHSTYTFDLYPDGWITLD